jgi:hypothetical protein
MDKLKRHQDIHAAAVKQARSMDRDPEPGGDN